MSPPAGCRLTARGRTHLCFPCKIGRATPWLMHAPLRRWLLHSLHRYFWLRPLLLMLITWLRSTLAARCWKRSSTGRMQALPRDPLDSPVRGCVFDSPHALLAWLWPLARLARPPTLLLPCLRASIALRCLSRRLAGLCWPA